jgi:hypothetical protein
MMTFRGKVDGPRVQGLVQGNTFNSTFHDRGGTGSFRGNDRNERQYAAEYLYSCEVGGMGAFLLQRSVANEFVGPLDEPFHVGGIGMAAIMLTPCKLSA